MTDLSCHDDERKLRETGPETSKRKQKNHACKKGRGARWGRMRSGRKKGGRGSYSTLSKGSLRGRRNWTMSSGPSTHSRVQLERTWFSSIEDEEAKELPHHLHDSEQALHTFHALSTREHE
eukprot:766195-Hanusia_phi.AAC.9